jgi:hypothetical protein
MKVNNISELQFHDPSDQVGPRASLDTTVKKWIPDTAGILEVYYYKINNNIVSQYLNPDVHALHSHHCENFKYSIFSYNLALNLANIL